MPGQRPGEDQYLLELYGNRWICELPALAV